MEYDLEELEKRIEALEDKAHEPFDFTHLIKRLEAVERYIEEHKALVQQTRVER